MTWFRVMRSRGAAAARTYRRGGVQGGQDSWDRQGPGLRGELAHRPDPAMVHALLLGPLFAWLITLDEDPAAARGRSIHRSDGDVGASQS